jgi:hypothetical protein
MNWNHRVVNCPSENGGDDYFTFKEVYYDDQDRPDAYSNPFMGGDSIDEVQELLMRLHTALQKPVLHENDFGEV